MSDDDSDNVTTMIQCLYCEYFLYAHICITYKAVSQEYVRQ